MLGSQGPHNTKSPKFPKRCQSPKNLKTQKVQSLQRDPRVTKKLKTQKVLSVQRYPRVQRISKDQEFLVSKEIYESKELQTPSVLVVPAVPVLCEAHNHNAVGPYKTVYDLLSQLNKRMTTFENMKRQQLGYISSVSSGRLIRSSSKDAWKRHQHT